MMDIETFSSPSSSYLSIHPISPSTSPVTSPQNASSPPQPFHFTPPTYSAAPLHQLFLQWMSLPTTESFIKEAIHSIRSIEQPTTPHVATAIDRSHHDDDDHRLKPSHQQEVIEASPPATSRRLTATATQLAQEINPAATDLTKGNKRKSGPAGSGPAQLQIDFSRLSSPSPPRSPAPNRGRLSFSSPTPTNKANATGQGIRQFYFPEGQPVSPATKTREMGLIKQLFSKHPDGMSVEDLYPVTTLICGFSSYCNCALYERLEKLQTDPLNKGKITEEIFLNYWQAELEKFDLPTRFYRLLRQNGNKFLTRDDFKPIVQEIVNRHPGLEFLEATPEFQLRYAQTVIARIFYQVNKSGNERITLRELRNSNFLLMLALLDQEEDINKINDYFSYEHFYVIYCKFWELDTDHDSLLDSADLIRYDDCALTGKMIDRVMAGCGRKLMSGVPGKMGYLDFVIFLISEVDKTSDVSLDYWFNCIDLDGDGIVASYEVEYFFAEQKQRMQALSQEVVMFPDILCQLVDMVKKPLVSTDRGTMRSEHTYHMAKDFVNMHHIGLMNRDIDLESSFTKAELKASHMAPMFFNTLFNLNKFILAEQRDPIRIKQVHATPQLTDWDRYAISGYYRLAECDQEQEYEQQQSEVVGMVEGVDGTGALQQMAEPEPYDLAWEDDDEKRGNNGDDMDTEGNPYPVGQGNFVMPDGTKMTREEVGNAFYQTVEDDDDDEVELEFEVEEDEKRDTEDALMLNTNNNVKSAKDKSKHRKNSKTKSSDSTSSSSSSTTTGGKTKPGQK